jgi:hypothetical protein
MWQKISSTKDRLVYSNGSEEAILDLIYSHSELGNFYMFNQSNAIPYQRKYILDLILQNESLGLRKDELVNLLQQSIDFTKKGDTHNAFSIQTNILNRIKDEWSYYHSNMLIAAAFIVSENENIGTFSQTLAEQKINEWGVDKEMTAFFLNKVQQLTTNLMTGLQQISNDVLKMEEQSKVEEVPTLATFLNE